MEKLAGAVILYNPDIGLWKRILTYLPHLERLYILDNSPKSNKHLFPNDLEFSKCQYILNNENLGISEPLNIACERAIQDGFNWLLTMDQDSFYNDQSFIQYMNCIQNFENRNNVGMFGSQYNLVNPDFLKCQFNEVEHLITSGSILNLAVFSQIGPFDKNLYIDGVDQEYSFRIIINNYKVIRFENISFQHELGSNQSFRSLKNGKKTNRSLHSPYRMYYMIRNHLYLKKNYKTEFPKDLQETQKDILLRLKNNFLYRKDRLMLIKLVIKAFRDYKRNNMGKFK